MQIRTGTARSGDLDIYYEDMGEPTDPAVLLIMGLGSQLLLWRDGFCEKLVAQGLRVIRYDNRDVGLSSKTERRSNGGAMIPSMVKFFVGVPGSADYRLEDMADDAAALLDHLEIDKAHIVGASMGGMIAQIFAARFKERTRSLAVIFSSNNQPFLPPPHPQALFAVLRGPSPKSPIDVIADYSVKVWRIIGSPRYPAPEQRLRDDAIRAYERCYYPWGTARHFSAIIASGSLAHYDRQITAPTVVLHGKADKLQRPYGGRVVARAIKGARLVLFDGMGHDLPEELWDDITGELTTTFALA
ncbi:alpha/beta hydrolase [Mycobacterium sp.]|uniref:alpha/beta fold hydrolase n=1 Tax=Mycobacterium sp. TaxID=1785 RepID=UPI0025E02457|nr:alpha/beta hydrolase [Mycobacterium sp.]